MCGTVRSVSAGGGGAGPAQAQLRSRIPVRVADTPVLLQLLQGGALAGKSLSPLLFYAVVYLRSRCFFVALFTNRLLVIGVSCRCLLCHII